MEEYKDNDNSINYQDLDVNHEEDEICVVELLLETPYTYSNVKIGGKT